MYEHVDNKEDRKTWQLVCRGWYHAVNDDVARITIKIPTGPSSYQKLNDDLEKHPTFASKILSIVYECVDYNVIYEDMPL